MRQQVTSTKQMRKLFKISLYKKRQQSLALLRESLSYATTNTIIGSGVSTKSKVKRDRESGETALGFKIG